MGLSENLENLPNLKDDHLSDWHTVLAEAAKTPDPLRLRNFGVTMADALAAQAHAKSIIGLLEAEIVRRWKDVVYCQNEV